jgi:uncharacterized protein CbrC (UPF0167 family)
VVLDRCAAQWTDDPSGVIDRISGAGTWFQPRWLAACLAAAGFGFRLDVSEVDDGLAGYADQCYEAAVSQQQDVIFVSPS